MPADAVILFVDSMEPSVRQLVLEACAHAQLTAHECGDQAGTVSGVLKPLYAIGAVAPGQRAIPASIARRLAEQFPGVPLVMLCSEQLVQPSVSLQRGRITLIGSPLTRDKITAQLRLPPARDTAAVPPDEASHTALLGREGASQLLRLREYRGVGWWSACIWRRGPAGSGGRQEIRPLIGRRSGLGYVGLFPTAPGAILGEGLLEAFAQAPDDPDPEHRLASLVQRLEGQVAALWLHPKRRVWLIAAPAHGPEFWLLSQQRLPQRWCVNRTLCEPRTGIRVLEAAGDDLIAAVFARQRGDEALAPTARTDPGAWPVASGPALLDHLEAQMHSDAHLDAALLVELRP